VHRNDSPEQMLVVESRLPVIDFGGLTSQMEHSTADPISDRSTMTCAGLQVDAKAVEPSHCAASDAARRT
jgi:hypothetical protein